MRGSELANIHMTMASYDDEPIFACIVYFVKVSGFSVAQRMTASFATPPIGPNGAHAGMARHRCGARGNGKVSALPLEELFS